MADPQRGSNKSTRSGDAADNSRMTLRNLLRAHPATSLELNFGAAAAPPPTLSFLPANRVIASPEERRRYLVSVIDSALAVVNDENFSYSSASSTTSTRSSSPSPREEDDQSRGEAQ